MFVNMIHTKRSSQVAGAGKRHQRGDTMIEVLVTMIVIAVGVLGAAALQITTLKNLSASHSASIASIVTDDFSERMRANPTAALDDRYVHWGRPEVAPPKNCSAEVCDPDELAAYDIDQWWDELESLLPRPFAGVVRVAGTDTFRLTVHWDEDRSGARYFTCPTDGHEENFECYRFMITL